MYPDAPSLPDEKLILRRIMQVPGIDRLPEQKAARAVESAFEYAEYSETTGSAVIKSAGPDSVMTDRFVIESGLISGIFNPGPVSGRILIFVVSLGRSFDERVSAAQLSGGLESYLLDTAGSIMVSAAVDNIGRRITDRARSSGKKTAGPLLPGSCGWDVRRGLEDIFSALTCGLPEGIFLTPGGMISPNKSAAGIFIESECLSAVKPCGSCSDSSCGYRLL